jgi:hypothetical protein
VSIEKVGMVRLRNERAENLSPLAPDSPRCRRDARRLCSMNT